MKEMEMIATSFAANLLLSMFFSFMSSLFAYRLGNQRKLLRAVVSFSISTLVYGLASLIVRPVDEAFLILVIGVISFFNGLIAAYILVDLYPPWGGPPSASST
jgi:hypothetical protein